MANPPKILLSFVGAGFAAILKILSDVFVGSLDVTFVKPPKAVVVVVAGNALLVFVENELLSVVVTVFGDNRDFGLERGDDGGKAVGILKILSSSLNGIFVDFSFLASIRASGL